MLGYRCQFRTLHWRPTDTVAIRFLIFLNLLRKTNIPEMTPEKNPLFMMTSSNGNFPRYWPFVRGIHRSTVNFPHKGQWCGALMFSLICVWTNGWVNNRDAGDLRHHRVHYDATVMYHPHHLHVSLWYLKSVPPPVLAKGLQVSLLYVSGDSTLTMLGAAACCANSHRTAAQRVVLWRVSDPYSHWVLLGVVISWRI